MQLEQEVIVFLIGNVTESGGVQMSSNFVANIQSMHDQRTQQQNHPNQKKSNILFIIEDN